VELVDLEGQVEEDQILHTVFLAVPVDHLLVVEEEVVDQDLEEAMSVVVVESQGETMGHLALEEELGALVVLVVVVPEDLDLEEDPVVVTEFLG
jgi:hypothetical protein